MDIFGHARAVNVFEDNNIGNFFFPFVNREGRTLILSNPIMYFINGLYISTLFITI